MPKRKVSLFMGVIIALLIMIILSITMSRERYSRTILVPLNGEEANPETDPGLAEIDRQICLYPGEGNTGQVLWTGSVCEVIYESLSGTKTVYYICPYLIASADIQLKDDPSVWQTGLKFARCAVVGGRLSASVPDFALDQVTFSCRTPEDAEMTDITYSSLDSLPVNGSYTTYSFPNRAIIGDDTELSARFGVKKSAKAADTALTDGERRVIVNWSFMISLNGRLVNDFDGVQVEIPYILEEKEEND